MQTRLDKKSVLINWVAIQLIKQGINLENFTYPEFNIHKIKETKPIHSIAQFPLIANDNTTHNPFILYKRESGHFCFREYMITENKQYKLVYQFDIFLHKKNESYI